MLSVRDAYQDWKEVERSIDIPKDSFACRPREDRIPSTCCTTSVYCRAIAPAPQARYDVYIVAEITEFFSMYIAGDGEISG